MPLNFVSVTGKMLNTSPTTTALSINHVSPEELDLTVTLNLTCVTVPGKEISAVLYPCVVCKPVAVVENLLSAAAGSIP